MSSNKKIYILAIILFIILLNPNTIKASLSLTGGNSATTTPNVATAITGFQIIGAAASTTPVKLFSTSGTLSMTNTTGLTFTGSQTGSVIYFSGTVENINNALSTLTYTRATTGTDTLEVSLVPFGEAFFTGNGHLYKFISGNINWNNAFIAAQNQTAYGVNGYLATITSAEENAFVSGRLTGDGWIGGSDSASEGVWKWVSGPEAGTTFWNGLGNGSTPNYASWASGEPNDSGNEDCAQTYVASGNWNDLPCTFVISGYVAEFGSNGNLPAVVAKNISIVTADVPAITSLSPSNGSTNATANQNLVIGFSKAVSTSTGDISIRKTSDNSLVENIDVSSAQITGGGTNTITINPNTTLTEGENYYINIPNTAFKDISNNFFNGISGTSTWAFTILDQTAPIITNISTSSIATTSAVISWDTNELSSSRIFYSTGSSYASSTVLANISPRVLNHSINISNLSSCTTYNYKIVSSDTTGNTSTSTSNLFTTTGCPAPTLSATTTTASVSTSSTSSLSENGKTITVITPPNVTSTSSTLTIQIKGLDSETVFDSINKPTGMTSGSNIVFDVIAIINESIILESFDIPVTISYIYTDEEVASLDENTLSMYHYHNNSWSKLNNCSVNTTTNTISCTTQGFSIFGIFGTPIVNINSAASPGSSTKLGCKDIYASNYDYFSSHDANMCKYNKNNPTLISTSTKFVFNRTLKIGSKGDDVKMLQKFLNENNFTISTSGPGSIGNETNIFGIKTRNAVNKFQEKYKNEILKNQGFSKPTGVFGPMSIKILNEIINKNK